MEIEIRVVDGREDDTAALWNWLRDESALRGRVRQHRQAISGTELGSVTDLLIVTLGAGGAGAVLAQSLATWLASRAAVVRGPTKLSIEANGRTVVVTTRNSEDLSVALDRMLRSPDEPAQG